MSGLHLTVRTLGDVDIIERYSIDRWGQRVADQYIADLGAALARLAAEPTLFARREGYAGRLRYYRVREHVLVGDVIDGAAYVLAIWHGSMDFIDRLPRLEPQLTQEAELLARQIESRSTTTT